MGVHFSLERGTWALFLILEARYVKPSLAFQPQRMWERVPGEQQPVELVPFQRVGAVPGASGPDLVHCELRLDRDLGKWPSALTMPVCSSGCAQQLARQPEGSFEASSLSLSLHQLALQGGEGQQPHPAPLHARSPHRWEHQSHVPPSCGWSCALGVAGPPVPFLSALVVHAGV